MSKLAKSLCLNLKMFHSITFNGRKIIKIIILKVALSPSKENYFFCVTEWPLKIIKNAFYFILKALFVLKISKFLSWIFGHIEKMAWWARKG